MQENILEVRDLSMSFFNQHGELPAVNHVSFSVEKGKTLGIVGESGCGKSMTSLCVMGLYPRPQGRIVGGSILFQGRDLTRLKPRELHKIRGKGIAMIFQEPMTSLNPVLTIGDQITETILLHEKVGKKEAKKRALDMISMVGIPMPEKVFASCPHQLSGGMRQRAMIAMALSCSPELLICDEPTTALDVTVQSQILSLINRMKDRTGASVMLITHDMGVINEMADTVIVMYAGQIVEQAETGELFAHPTHPYTLGLIQSIPPLDREVEELNVIPGSVPMLYELPEGCLFSPRCPYATERCRRERPDVTRASENHFVRCFRHMPGWEGD
ncbi:MAG: ABC transporter ATP-binding protein [Clostridia bacterium]|nr:ABC transporter ATP-binding protein [Clostridia bacterium]